MKLFYVEHADAKEPEKLVVFAYIARNHAHLDELMAAKFSSWGVVQDTNGYQLNKNWSNFHGA